MYSEGSLKCGQQSSVFNQITKKNKKNGTPTIKVHSQNFAELPYYLNEILQQGLTDHSGGL